MHGSNCLFRYHFVQEMHFDSSRNFVALATGRRRYILTPPSQCDQLKLLKEGPSMRHSSVDWTSPEGIAAVGSAAAVEVVLEPGDVLYIPAYWGHFIVSLNTNVQCSFRGGTPPYDGVFTSIEACGFAFRATASEDVGEFAEPEDAPPPVAHALAAALNGRDVIRSQVVPFSVVRALLRVIRRFQHLAAR